MDEPRSFASSLAMKYQSCSTQVVDPYRAGAEMGDQLRRLEPDVVLLFHSIHYLESLQEVAGGLREMLGSRILLCGGSGDGVYADGRVMHHGMSALGIRSERGVRWSAALERGVGADSARAAELAAHRAVTPLKGAPALAFVLADGLRADGTAVVDGVRRVLGDTVFFGGLTADDRRFARAGVFAGDDVSEDAVMVLAASGDISFRVNAASGWRPVGEFGRIAEVQGPRILRIGEQTAAAFIEEQIGRIPEQVSLATVPLAVYSGEDESSFELRSPRHTDSRTGEVSLFGQVPAGARVRICGASIEDVIGGVDTALSGLTGGDIEPGAVVMVSCVCRKWQLVQSGGEEVERAGKALGELPLIGMPSLGEIGPARQGDTPTRVGFHNVTLVAGLLGR